MAIIKVISATCMLTVVGITAFRTPIITQTNVYRNYCIHNSTYTKLGQQIRIARESRLVNHEVLADAVGIEKIQLIAIEQGKTIPVKEIVFKIEEVLETTFTMDELLYN